MLECSLLFISNVINFSILIIYFYFSKMLAGLKNYFNMGKWEAIAIISMCSIVLILAAINYSMPFFIKQNAFDKNDSLALQQLATNISADTNAHKSFYVKSENDGSKITPFNFNPNTLTEDGFKKLGLGDKTVATILNYRNKGGHFYSKHDVEKMYSLSTAEYQKLETFIDLPNEATNKFEHKDYNPIIVKLNTCDTAELIKMRGIGPAGAFRIVEYRKSIGGFYSINQLLEVYGMADSTIQNLKAQFIIDENKIKKININTVLFQELSMHPYFKNLALPIIKYRKLKGGTIKNLEELKSLPELTPAFWEKIKHYIFV
jgi:competence protein ComEA